MDQRATAAAAVELGSHQGNPVPHPQLCSVSQQPGGAARPGRRVHHGHSGRLRQDRDLPDRDLQDRFWQISVRRQGGHVLRGGLLGNPLLRLQGSCELGQGNGKVRANHHSRRIYEVRFYHFFFQTAILYFSAIITMIVSNAACQMSRMSRCRSAVSQMSG